MRRIILINLCIMIVFFALLEVGSRTFLYFSRGSSTAGMPERTLYLNYQPFVMFGPNWDEKLQTDTTHSRPRTIHRILLVGGSTAALFPSPLLVAAFHKRFPDQQFEVINLAEGGYNARQEVVALALWGPSLSPDLIITLDGANDLTHRLRMKKAGSFFLQEAYDLALKHPFLAPIADILRHSQFIQGMQRLQEHHTIKSFEQYADAIPIYIAAQHSMNILAKGLSAKRLIVLQPFLSFKNPLSSPEKKFNHYQYREAVIMKLYEANHNALTHLAKQDHVLYLDGRLIYHGIDQTIFSDDVHFINDEGYRVLAKNIAEAVA